MGKKLTQEEKDFLKKIFTEEEGELLGRALAVYSETNSFITLNLGYFGEQLKVNEEIAKRRDSESKLLKELEKKIDELF